ncbi:pentatricopeptide repeat-containing protein At1g61870, mitochondrial-like [Actinidia eriantha]|uniref:pentatricopeptide repeat-containing protein At1g61870, mitochondrial-like n=1 Tax=Actinidia eriantha TaxID=165200 RepID=UPI002587D05D|nr:pentatricopeptide repeat-containing protein At1g61870, mitochondrial-like [Actinidia eriantha]
MAFLSKLRLTSAQRRNFSSILNPDSKTPLTSKQKSRAALSLLKTEKNPERILDICRAASLTPEYHLDRIIFSEAISKLADSNHFEGIRSFLEELKARRDLQNERFMAHAIVLYGQAGMLDNAHQTFDKMRELGVDRTAKSLNALLFSCVVAKKYDEVKRIYVEFPKKYGIEPNLDTYNTVIKSFCESGSSSSVYSVLAEMDRKRCKPNATSFGTLIAGFYKEEKYEDVGKVLDLMKKYDMHPGISTYNIRIQSLCKLKKSVEARALLDGMLSRGMKPNSVTYCHLIHGFCKEGNLDEAKNLFKKMVNSGCQPDSDCYFTLVYFLCQSGDFETALQICKESMEKGWVPNFSTMKSLVNGLASLSKVDEARELVGQMKEKFSKFADSWNEVEESLPK